MIVERVETQAEVQNVHALKACSQAALAKAVCNAVYNHYGPALYRFHMT